MGLRDIGTNSNRQYYRILRNFGGSNSIQGLEDAPIDPDAEDAKFIGLTVLIGATILAITPQEMIALGWVATGTVVGLAGLAMYVCPSERAPIEWLVAMGRFKVPLSASLTTPRIPRNARRRSPSRAHPADERGRRAP